MHFSPFFLKTIFLGARIESFYKLLGLHFLSVHSLRRSLFYSNVTVTYDAILFLVSQSELTLWWYLNDILRIFSRKTNTALFIHRASRYLLGLCALGALCVVEVA